jgi:pilus assembly protein CpaF
MTTAITTNGNGNWANDERRAARDELAVRLHSWLVQELDVSAIDALPLDERRARIESAMTRGLAELGASVMGVQKQELLDEVLAEVVGYGPVQPLLDDPDITEIMVNSPNEVYYERDGVLHTSSARFRDQAHIRRIADRIVTPLGRRLDEASPMVDARLPDGSRVNVVLPPIAAYSPTITIRKFRQDRFDMVDLVDTGTLSDPAAEFLHACVVAKLNVVISGGTGSGKTTMLSALSGSVDPHERVVLIEDPMEIRLRAGHVVSLEARPPATEGRAAVTQRDLVRNALRMRPDRIILGEVRGPEAFDMMQAMNTGHEGSMSTVHANSSRDALARIENMVLMAGFDLPVRAIREQLASALHVIVQMQRFMDGSRRVVAITEVAGMEGDVVALQDVFAFENQRMTADGRTEGTLTATGIRPAFVDRFRHFGVTEYGLGDPLLEWGR